MDNAKILEAAAPRARTVLVVEDEPLLRLVICDLLRAEGVTVVEAANAVEAMEALAGGLAVDAIFTDVRMPGPFDGLELSRKVQATQPELPVVVTSGHLDGSLVGAGIVFLPKPYLPGEAATIILGLVERRRAYGG